MARRLADGAIVTGPPEGGIGREFCRNCGGGIVIDAADHRSSRVPHRRLCRRCGDEYGTTPGPLHPDREEYSTAPRGFYAEDA
jgi:hypothetical protein